MTIRNFNFVDNGADALKVLQEKSGDIDIVLSDISMPEMDGLPLLQKIHQLNPIIKVIMISAHSEIENIRAAMNREAFDFVTKPIDLIDLEITIRRTYTHILTLRNVNVKLQNSYSQLKKTMEQTIQSMATIAEIRDPYTAGHQRRVAQLAKAIASEMNLPTGQVEGIFVAGILHDIGKICIPSELLSRPGSLTKNEFDLIKDHTRAGYDILKAIDFPWPIANIILMHHEKLDGSGRPNGLAGDEILLKAKILSVADVVEAVASYRPYRPGLGTEKALKVISQSKGVEFDSSIVEVCIKLFFEKDFEFD